MCSQRLYFPALQGSQARQDAPGSRATASPGLCVVTALPVLKTMPEDSCPRTWRALASVASEASEASVGEGRKEGEG